LCKFLLDQQELIFLVRGNKIKMVLEDEMKKGEASGETSEKMGLSRKNSGSSLSPTEDDEEDEDKKLELGPMIALKEQLERDKVFYFIYYTKYVNYTRLWMGEKC